MLQQHSTLRNVSLIIGDVTIHAIGPFHKVNYYYHHQKTVETLNVYFSSTQNVNKKITIYTIYKNYLIAVTFILGKLFINHLQLMITVQFNNVIFSGAFIWIKIQSHSFWMWTEWRRTNCSGDEESDGKIRREFLMTLLRHLKTDFFFVIILSLHCIGFVGKLCEWRDNYYYLWFLKSIKE